MDRAPVRQSGPGRTYALGSTPGGSSGTGRAVRLPGFLGGQLSRRRPVRLLQRPLLMMVFHSPMARSASTATTATPTAAMTAPTMAPAPSGGARTVHWMLTKL